MRDRIQEALKRSKADYTEIRIEEKESTRVVFRGKDLETANANLDKGGIVRCLMRDKGWGVTTFNNLDDLLTYTAGTEVEGLSGNFSGSSFNSGGFQEFNGASRRVQSETRVRGLGAADQTRDYFLTDSPMDGYNIDRVEVNRGPNAILFGLGSPGGIVISGLVRGLTNKTNTKVEFQFDQEASQRYVLDHNQVLIKDVLALRFAGL